MGQRHLVRIHWVVVFWQGLAATNVKDQLMPEKVEINPRGVLATKAAAQNLGIKDFSLLQVCARESQVERPDHLFVSRYGKAITVYRTSGAGKMAGSPL
jgi:hypothetical protein